MTSCKKDPPSDSQTQLLTHHSTTGQSTSLLHHIKLVLKERLISDRTSSLTDTTYTLPSKLSQCNLLRSCHSLTTKTNQETFPLLRETQITPSTTCETKKS